VCEVRSRCSWIVTCRLVTHTNSTGQHDRRNFYFTNFQLASNTTYYSVYRPTFLAELIIRLALKVDSYSWYYVRVCVCVCVTEEQGSIKTVEQSTDKSELSCTTSPTVKVSFQSCVVFTVKSSLYWVLLMFGSLFWRCQQIQASHFTRICGSSVNDNSTKGDPARLGRISDKKDKGLRFQRMWTLRRTINCRFHKLANYTTEQCYSIWQWR